MPETNLSVSMQGNVWSVRHCARHLGVNENFYRRNILIKSNHPQAINPENRRWNFWAEQVRKFHASLLDEQP